MAESNNTQRSGLASLGSALREKVPSISPAKKKKIRNLSVAGIASAVVLASVYFIGVGIKRKYTSATTPTSCEYPVVMQSQTTNNYDIDFHITGPTNNSLEFNLQTQKSASITISDTIPALSPTAQIESPTEVPPANTPVPPAPAYTPVPPASKGLQVNLNMPGQNSDLWAVCNQPDVPDYMIGVHQDKGNIAGLVEQGYVFHSQGMGPNSQAIGDSKFVNNDWQWMRALSEYAGQVIPELSIYGVSPDGKHTNEMTYHNFQMPLCIGGPGDGRNGQEPDDSGRGDGGNGQEPCPSCDDPGRYENPSNPSRS